jgi:hypothetical protein
VTPYNLVEVHIRFGGTYCLHHQDHWACFSLILHFDPEETALRCSQTYVDITPCSPLKVNRRFGGTYHLNIHSSVCHLLSRWFFPRLVLWSWRWRRHVPPKRRLTVNGLQGVISHKIVLFITTAVRPSNPTLVLSWRQQQLVSWWYACRYQVVFCEGTIFILVCLIFAISRYLINTEYLCSLFTRRGPCAILFMLP